MATLAFQVHTDKENETPHLRPIDKNLKGRSLQSFSKGSSKLTQPTPRKALGSVNQQFPPVSQGVKERILDSSQGPIEALFKSKNSVVDENLQVGHFTKKPKTKKSPVVHTGLKKPSASKNTFKARTPKSKVKPVEPIPKIPDDVEYDSDTIFPRTDRLSCYVEKLLTWRPPCLFGTVPDSDSDISYEIEDLNQSITIDEIPVDLCEVDDQDLPQDLSELLVDLPSLSPSPLDVGVPSQSDSYEPLNEQSLDTSLHLGSLQLNTSNLDEIDLGLGTQK